MYNRRKCTAWGVIAGVTGMILLLASAAVAEEVPAAPASVQDKAFETKTVEDMLTASIRYQGAYEDMVSYIPALMSAAGVSIAGPMFSLYHDDGAGDVHDVEVCVPVSDSVTAEGVTTRILEGGRMLSCIYTGPYEKLDEAWGELYRYIQENKLQTGMPVREIYLAWDEKDPSKNVTELQVPLVSAE